MSLEEGSVLSIHYFGHHSCRSEAVHATSSFNAHILYSTQI